jgi:predicted RNA methylase
MQDTGKNRNIIDKFYTKPDVSKNCIEEFQKFIDIKTEDIVIEPSAGNGSFLQHLYSLHLKNVYAFDIEPEHEKIVKQDFLELDYSKFPKTNKIYLIGNPPFGRQSSIAKKFIKYSCNFADALGFILPKSFKKETLQSTFPLQFHLVSTIDIPKNSFLLNEKEYDVPCVFQVWIKKETSREISTIEKPDYFEYVKKNESPDLSFRRVGVYAGKIDKEYLSKSEESHYFLKFREGFNIDTFITFYNETVKFEFDNTAGPRSISKKELHFKLKNIEL